MLAAALVAGAAAIAWSGPAGRPPVPPGVCAGDRAPRYDALHADGRLTVAAVFGQIGDRPLARDLGWASRRMLVDALAARGFVREADDRYVRDADGRRPAVELTLTGPDRLPRAFPALTAHALAEALATADVVYYNGHVFEGAMPLAARDDGYTIVVMDSCWSTQHYSRALAGGEVGAGEAAAVDVIGNRERAITGSALSFVALLDGLDARAPRWSAIVAPMNALADARARGRIGKTRWDRAEEYSLDVACE